jgi:hypothetical protein
LRWLMASMRALMNCVAAVCACGCFIVLLTLLFDIS